MPRKGKFRCAKCKRTFALAMHLGRHNSTVHGLKKAPAAARAVTHVGRKRPGRPAAGDGAARVREELRAARDELAAQLAALDAALTALS